MSSDTYNPESDTSTLPAGVQRLDVDHLANLHLDDNTLKLLKDQTGQGSQFSLYYDSQNKQYIVGNRGTQSGADVFTDLEQFAGLDTASYDNAKALAQSLKTELGTNILFTGHSLGGGLADVESLATGFQAITFNAAGLSDNTMLGLKTANANSLITNYHIDNEILTTTQNSPFMSALSDLLVTPVANGIEAGKSVFGGNAPYTGLAGIPAALGQQIELPAMDTFLDTNRTLETGQSLDAFRLSSPFTMLGLHGILNVAGGYEGLIQQQFGSLRPTQPVSSAPGG